MISSKTSEELRNIAKTSGWDLIHDLMLKDIIETSDGFYLERASGDIGYNNFLGKPNLSDTTMQRMANEINKLSLDAKSEVLNDLKEKFPDIYSKLPYFKH